MRAVSGTPANGNAGVPDSPEAVQAERLARARSRSVFIATPIARQPARQYTFSLAKTLVHLAQLSIRCWMQQVVGNSNLPRARNELVASFLASDYTDLLFIDDDMGWQANDVVRLLASPRAVIGGIGCKKVMCADTDPQKWCLRTLGGQIRQDDMGAIEVEAVGTGFLKIERSVFERMQLIHPEWKRRGWPNMPAPTREQYYEFFRFSHEGEEEFGEDIGFCREYRSMGGTIWIDPTIKLIHVGEHEYTGNLEALLEALPEQRVSPIGALE
jgi:hypothetical protein